MHVHWTQYVKSVEARLNVTVRVFPDMNEIIPRGQGVADVNAVHALFRIEKKKNSIDKY